MPEAEPLIREKPALHSELDQLQGDSGLIAVVINDQPLSSRLARVCIIVGHEGCMLRSSRQKETERYASVTRRHIIYTSTTRNVNYFAMVRARINEIGCGKNDIMSVIERVGCE